jgi:hypothetical protein
MDRSTSSNAACPLCHPFVFLQRPYAKQRQPHAQLDTLHDEEAGLADSPRDDDRFAGSRPGGWLRRLLRRAAHPSSSKATDDARNKGWEAGDDLQLQPRFAAATATGRQLQVTVKTTAAAFHSELPPAAAPATSIVLVEAQQRWPSHGQGAQPAAALAGEVAPTQQPSTTLPPLKVYSAGARGGSRLPSPSLSSGSRSQAQDVHTPSGPPHGPGAAGQRSATSSEDGLRPGPAGGPLHAPAGPPGLDHAPVAWYSRALHKQLTSVAQAAVIAGQGGAEKQHVA